MAPTTVEVQRLMSAAEVCAVFNICDATLANWRKAGHFPEPTTRIGKRMFWRPEVVRAVVEGRK